MNKFFKKAIVCSAVVISIMQICIAVPLQQRPAAQQLGPAEVVQKFYAAHFAGNKSFTLANINRKRKWFSPELYKMLVAELHRKYPPDEVPNIEGDPFTDSQEYPRKFVVGKSDINGDKASVELALQWIVRGKVTETRNLKIELVNRSGSWLISNIIYRPDQDLIGLLKHDN